MTFPRKGITPDQEARMSKREAVIEECAKVADGLRDKWRELRRNGAGESLGWAAAAAGDIAQAIRSLAPEPSSPATEGRVSDNAWDRIGADPVLANARRKLSIHEIWLIIQHAQARHVAALDAILADPHGCRFCDYGKLRSPDKPGKGHDETCGFALAAALVSEPSQS